MTADSPYYADKLDSLKALFGGADARLEDGAVLIDGRRYPVVDDVVVLLPPDRWPASLRARLSPTEASAPSPRPFAADVQFTFGAEWTAYDAVLPEHEDEFRRYFDLVDVQALKDLRVCDLGCGIGRWSFFLADRCRELVLVDFSEAVFAARRNLRGRGRCLFFMGDLTDLPFADDAFGFLFCLGVLHHLPTDCLEETVRLRRLSRRLLIFLYYALDNRPAYFRWILSGVTLARKALCRVRSGVFRKAFSWAAALAVYKPLVLLGGLLAPAGLGRFVPLYEFYRGKSLRRLEQDVYDRFFTRIEQRVSRREIEGLSRVFARVVVSPRLPYWHFLAER